MPSYPRKYFYQHFGVYCTCLHCCTYLQCGKVLQQSLWKSACSTPTTIKRQKCNYPRQVMNPGTTNTIGYGVVATAKCNMDGMQNFYVAHQVHMMRFQSQLALSKNKRCRDGVMNNVSPSLFFGTVKSPHPTSALNSLTLGWSS